MSKNEIFATFMHNISAKNRSGLCDNVRLVSPYSANLSLRFSVSDCKKFGLAITANYHKL